MVTIAKRIEQVKADLPRLIGTHVKEYLRQQGWRGRVRLLDPLNTVLLFVVQVMHGNTAITHLPHLAQIAFTATAYCKARGRLALGLLEYVSHAVARQLLPQSDRAHRWRGHRVWYADGSSFSMPDRPELQDYFGQPGNQSPGCGFPVATWLVLCSATGFIVKTLTLPLRVHDASQIHKLHDQMERGDVLVYDRAGCSYAHLALMFKRELQAIVRMHQRRIVSFRPGRRTAGRHGKGHRAGKPRSQWVQRLGRQDQLVRWRKPVNRPKWMTEEEYVQLPDELVLRELRYAVAMKGYRSRSVTLVTTLIDSRTYPAGELAEQYLGRWNVELNFRHLKQTMKMDVLKCQTLDGVRKELAVYVLVYNLVRLVMLRAAERQKVPVDRISFIDALRWLAIPDDGGEMPDLVVNPHRPGRVEPRVIKRRGKSYDLMTQPRHVLRQALLRDAVAA
jgi:hypothetical protein